MEMRKTNSPYQDILKAAAASEVVSTRQILFGNNNYRSGFKYRPNISNFPPQGPELKRLTDVKIHFDSLASDKGYRPSLLFDRVWASAKALGRYLKLNKLK
jgi:hypothetical protein